MKNAGMDLDGASLETGYKASELGHAGPAKAKRRLDQMLGENEPAESDPNYAQSGCLPTAGRKFKY